MGEKTLIKTMELPAGRDWEWFGDANVVVLAAHLDEEGRQRALTEVQAFWRRSCIRVVPAESWKPAGGPGTGPQLPQSRSPNGNVVSDRQMA